MNKYDFNLLEEETPKYMQISKRLKKLIDKGDVEDGEKLPSIRGLALMLKVNNVTIVNAYKNLELEGYVIQKIGSGTYAKRRDISKNFKKHYSETFKKLSSGELKEYIDFTGETTSSDFFPVATFKAVLNEVLDRDGAEALVYQDVLGYKGLRESISINFWNENIGEDNILIVSGAQQGIDIASKAMINVNDNVVIEKPTYSGALSVFKSRRANIIEIDMLEDGADIDKLEEILKKTRIRCFYTMSYFHNPTGLTLSNEKKQRLLYLAEKYDFYIIEDDYLSELIYDVNIKYNSLKSMDKNDRVVYIKSFSKIFLPGIRIGYLISPKEFKEQIQNSKIDTDISTSSLMQRALDSYIRNDFWKEHIRQLNSIYKERYDFMIEAIQQILGKKVVFHLPGGGLHLYIKILGDLNMNCMKLFYRCRNEKVLISPGILFYKNYKDGEKYFRLGFSQSNKSQILSGIETIEKVLKR